MHDLEDPSAALVVQRGKEQRGTTQGETVERERRVGKGGKKLVGRVK